MREQFVSDMKIDPGKIAELIRSRLSEYDDHQGNFVERRYGLTLSLESSVEEFIEQFGDEISEFLAQEWIDAAGEPKEK